MSKRTVIGVVILVSLSTLGCGESISAPAAPMYRISKTVALGAPDEWDHVVFDQVLNRVYVAHGNTVTVVDASSGALVGNIEGITGSTHGIASVHKLGKGYTTDSEAGIAISFDLKTLKIIHRIKAEPDADVILFDAPSGHVFAIDGDSGKVTIIDPKTDTVIATVDGGGGFECGVSGENGKFYVSGAQKNEIVRIDTAKNVIDAHWPTPSCKSPHGMAMDRSNAVLFVSCRANNVMDIVDAKTGAMLTELPIGDYTDDAAFDPNRRLAFSSNREGTLSIIAEKSPRHFVSMPEVTTPLGARTMAVNPENGRIFLVTADLVRNEAAADAMHRYAAKPGTVKLFFLDPVTKQSGGDEDQKE
jgi:YVTN family beta-propeller protein